MAVYQKEKSQTRKRSAEYLFKYFLLANFLQYLEAGAVPALLLSLSSAFDFGHGQEGLLGGVVYIALSFGGPFAGYLLRHCDHRTVIGNAIVANNIFTLFWALTPVKHAYSKILFITLRFFMGLAQCFLCVFLPLWINEYAPSARRTSWMGYLQASVPLGVMGGYIIASIVATLSNYSEMCLHLECWRWPFLIEVFLLLPLCVAFHFVPREHLNVKISSRRKDQVRSSKSNTAASYNSTTFLATRGRNYDNQANSTRPQTIISDWKGVEGYRDRDPPSILSHSSALSNQCENCDLSPTSWTPIEKKSSQYENDVHHTLELPFIEGGAAGETRININDVNCNHKAPVDDSSLKFEREHAHSLESMLIATVNESATDLNNAEWTEGNNIISPLNTWEDDQTPPRSQSVERRDRRRLRHQAISASIYNANASREILRRSCDDLPNLQSSDDLLMMISGAWYDNSDRAKDRAADIELDVSMHSDGNARNFFTTGLVDVRDPNTYTGPGIDPGIQQESSVWDSPPRPIPQWGSVTTDSPERNIEHKFSGDRSPLLPVYYAARGASTNYGALSTVDPLSRSKRSSSVANEVPINAHLPDSSTLTDGSTTRQRSYSSPRLKTIHNKSNLATYESLKEASRKAASQSAMSRLRQHMRDFLASHDVSLHLSQNSENSPRNSVGESIASAPLLSVSDKSLSSDTNTFTKRRRSSGSGPEDNSYQGREGWSEMPSGHREGSGSAHVSDEAEENNSIASSQTVPIYRNDQSDKSMWSNFWAIQSTEVESQQSKTETGVPNSSTKQLIPVAKKATFSSFLQIPSFPIFNKLQVNEMPPWNAENVRKQENLDGMNTKLNLRPHALHKNAKYVIDSGSDSESVSDDEWEGLGNNTGGSQYDGHAQDNGPGHSQRHCGSEKSYYSRTSAVTSPRSLESLLSTVYALLQIKVYRYLLAAMAALYFTVTGVQFWGTSYLFLALGASRALVQSLFIVCAATAPTSGVFFGGWLIDKLGGYKGAQQRVVALEACVVLGAFGCIFAAPITFIYNIYLVVILLWLLLFCGAAMLPACSGIIVSIVPRRSRPVSSSLSLVVFNLFGYFLSLVLSGYIMQIFSNKALNCTEACPLVWGFRIVLFWSGWSLLFLVLALLSSYRIVSDRQKAKRAAWQRVLDEAEESCRQIAHSGTKNSIYHGSGRDFVIPSPTTGLTGV